MSRATRTAARRRRRRERLCEAQNWRCCYCAVTVSLEVAFNDPARATVEHVQARCHGGRRTWENTAIACRRCNTTRGHRPPREFLRTVQAGAAP